MYLRKVAETAVYCGRSRGISVDFVSGKIAFYPPDILNVVLCHYKQESIENIIAQNKVIKQELLVIIERLTQESIFFKTEDPAFFPEMDVTFDSFRSIDNISVELPDFNDKYGNILSEFIAVIEPGALKIDLTQLSSRKNMELWLSALRQLPIPSIECVVDFNQTFVSRESLEKLVELNGAITLFSVFNKPENLQFEQDFAQLTRAVDGEIPFPKFFPSQELYLESLNYNTYFNRKIFVSTEGEIKVAKEFNEVIGNIYLSNSNLTTLLNQIYSANEWVSGAKKDRCDVCRDCEFRHMCVDNRIPIKRSNGSFFFETECPYNPYISKWKGQDGYLCLDECGISSDKSGFQINTGLLLSINEKIWQS